MGQVRANQEIGRKTSVLDDRTKRSPECLLFFGLLIHVRAMDDMRLRLLCISLACMLTAGCGNPLSTRTTFQVVSGVVRNAIIGKVIFDPIWAYCCADWTSSKLEALKNDFANIATQRIAERIIPSAHAKGLDFGCEPNEPQERCRARLTSLAEYEFNIYANDFVSALNLCRDDIVLNADTGALDLMHQVPLIDQCVANAGYEKEIAMINTKIAARLSLSPPRERG